ncbi:hypothetical protein NE237_006937 [Protea cynaroides]|uniref:Uncharacterized protein n=1 Tax=Protea cynaroides TaxID=273540 RepID=A0A9Q0KND3_9MAGN|nr:hypothetical protein NE237_006937 [Protea cynaroides]
MEKKTQKIFNYGYKQHAKHHAKHHEKHQHGLYVTSDFHNYIICEETKPACQDIEDAINHNHHHHHTYERTYGEKPVQRTGDQRAWVVKEYVHFCDENVDVEADEFIKKKHKNDIELSKFMSFKGL